MAAAYRCVPAVCRKSGRQLRPDQDMALREPVRRDQHRHPRRRRGASQGLCLGRVAGGRDPLPPSQPEPRQPLRPAESCMLTLTELIDAQAERRPDQAFLTFEGATITFAELRRRVRRAAAALQRAGFANGQRVILMMGNRPQHAIAYFALAALGCVVVEASIHFKRSGIELQLEDADPHHLIVDPASCRRCRGALQALGPRQADHDTGAERPSRRPAMSLSTGPAGHDRPAPRSIACRRSPTPRERPAGPRAWCMTERYFQVGAKNAALLADVGPADVLFLWEPFYHIAAWMSFIVGPAVRRSDRAGRALQRIADAGTRSAQRRRRCSTISAAR